MVFRRISCDYIKGENKFTQLELSRSLDISLSTVNNAVSNLSEINAVRVKNRSFEIIALDRLLLYWATHRNFNKDIIYTTRVDMPVKEIEGSMPDKVAYTCYTAYRFLYNDAPADYSEVYVYATEKGLSEIKRRFKYSEGIPNLIALKTDTILEKNIEEKSLEKSSVCAGQMFVDLWNTKTWYAKDFVDALAKRLRI